MILPVAARRILVLLALAVMASPPVNLRGQAALQIHLAATAAARLDAARVLVPLLRDVRRRSEDGLELKPGTLPDSPFTGKQTTLFAFTLSKRSVPVGPEVVRAMDRLLAWNIDDPKASEDAELFDEWLDQLSIKAAGLVTLHPPVICDAACVVSRMTKLDTSWGGSPRQRAEARDAMLLDALVTAVGKEQ